MDKRVFVAAAVSVLILLGWNYMFPPPKPPQLPDGPADTAVVEAQRPESTPFDDLERDSQAEVVPSGISAPEAVQAASVEEISVLIDPYEVTLSNRGGVATSWKLIDDTTGYEPLELLPWVGADNTVMLGADLDDPDLTREVNEALYHVERRRVSSDRGLPAGERIEFTWSDGKGLEAKKSLTFREGHYLIDVKLEIIDRGRRENVRLSLGPGFGAQELDSDGEPKKQTTYYYQAILWERGGKVTHRRKNKLDEQVEGIDGGARWAGLEDQYFAALILPHDPAASVRWRAKEFVVGAPGSQAKNDPESLPILSVSVPEAGVQLYVGPKKYRQLEALGDDLQQAVWFSSFPALAWISRHIFFGLLWIHDHTIPNYGLAIVLCTFLLRLLLFPVNQYSMVSMKKTQLQMQRLQPKIKAIKNKYKKSKDSQNRAKMNQEMMDLYKKEGVNPMGGVTGCLPMVAQIPILMAFYFMLTVAVELRGSPFFGWIHDLSAADPFYITPLLMGITMFAQQKMAMSKVKDPVQQQQQKFMMIMPFVFTWICIQMPAGMVLYWFVNNLLGIGQQYLVNRHTTRLEAAEQKA